MGTITNAQMVAVLCYAIAERADVLQAELIYAAEHNRQPDAEDVEAHAGIIAERAALLQKAVAGELTQEEFVAEAVHAQGLWDEFMEYSADTVEEELEGLPAKVDAFFILHNAGLLA